MVIVALLVRGCGCGCWTASVSFLGRRHNPCRGIRGSPTREMRSDAATATIATDGRGMGRVTLLLRL